MSENNEQLLAKPILQLYEALSALNGFVSILNNQLDSFRKGTIKLYEENDIDISSVMAGYNLLVQDLTEQSDPNPIPIFPVGGFSRQGEDYFSAADELIQKWAGFTLAQIFESLETYARNQAASLFWLYPPESPVGNLRQIPIEVSDYSAWQAFFRQNKWNIFTIMDLFRKQASDLERKEQNNIRKLNLQEWLSILATIRHAVTHSNSVFTKDNIRINHSQAKRMLRKHFPGVWEGDTYTLSVTRDNAKNNIEIAASYAYLIYKNLSKSVGLNGDKIGPKE